MLGEFSTPLEIIGVLFIVFGYYLLNITKINYGLLDPFKALLKKK